MYYASYLSIVLFLSIDDQLRSTPLLGLSEVEINCYTCNSWITSECLSSGGSIKSFFLRRWMCNNRHGINPWKWFSSSYSLMP
jgi:hypothetical protein